MQQPQIKLPTPPYEQLPVQQYRQPVLPAHQQPPVGQQPASPKKMHKAIYMICIGGGFLFCGLLTLWGSVDSKVDELLYFSWMPLILGLIALFIMIHKMWASIQDGMARTSPGRAVARLFIPLYNLYWMWQVFHGWAQDYNAFLERHHITSRKVSEGLFMTYVISSYVCFPVALVLLFVIVNAVCNAVNALSRS